MADPVRTGNTFSSMRVRPANRENGTVPVSDLIKTVLHLMGMCDQPSVLVIVIKFEPFTPFNVNPKRNPTVPPVTCKEIPFVTYGKSILNGAVVTEEEETQGSPEV